MDFIFFGQQIIKNNIGSIRKVSAPHKKVSQLVKRIGLLNITKYFKGSEQVGDNVLSKRSYNCRIFVTHVDFFLHLHHTYSIRFDVSSRISCFFAELFLSFSFDFPFPTTSRTQRPNSLWKGPNGLDDGICCYSYKQLLYKNRFHNVTERFQSIIFACKFLL